MPDRWKLFDVPADTEIVHFGNFLRWEADKRGGPAAMARNADIAIKSLERYFRASDPRPLNIRPYNQQKLAEAAGFESWDALDAAWRQTPKSVYKKRSSMLGKIGPSVLLDLLKGAHARGDRTHLDEQLDAIPKIERGIWPALSIRVMDMEDDDLVNFCAFMIPDVVNRLWVSNNPTVLVLISQAIEEIPSPHRDRLLLAVSDETEERLRHFVLRKFFADLMAGLDLNQRAALASLVGMERLTKLLKRPSDFVEPEDRGLPARVVKRMHADHANELRESEAGEAENLRMTLKPKQSGRPQKNAAYQMKAKATGKRRAQGSDPDAPR